MKYYLGVDTGGTKSHALITTEDGLVLGYGLGGPGNHEMIGYDGVQAVLQDIVGQALGMTGLHAEEISGAGFGIAGYDWSSERELTLGVIRTLGLTNAVIEACNDTLIGVLAGTVEGWGIAVDSGTGNNCWGRDKKGRTGQVTGCGWIMAEEGGAGEMTANGLRAISRAWSKRGRETLLTQIYCEAAGASGAGDLLEGLLNDRYQLDASIAPKIFWVAEQGDAVAQELIRHTGESLGDLVLGVARQLDLVKEAFQVVEIGSMFNGGARLEEPMKQFVWKEAPRAEFIRLAAPPVTGAVLLGMEAAGIRIREVREALIDSAMQVWKE